MYMKSSFERALAILQLENIVYEWPFQPATNEQAYKWTLMSFAHCTVGGVKKTILYFRVVSILQIISTKCQQLV